MYRTRRGTGESSLDPSFTPGFITSDTLASLAEEDYYVGIQKGRRRQAPDTWLEIRSPEARGAREYVTHQWPGYKQGAKWK